MLQERIVIMVRQGQPVAAFSDTDQAVNWLSQHQPDVDLVYMLNDGVPAQPASEGTGVFLFRMAQPGTNIHRASGDLSAEPGRAMQDTWPG